MCYNKYVEKAKLNENFYKNTLTLAYVGDSVFSLMVREYLVKKYDYKVNLLNKKANSVVCARCQAVLMEKLRPELDENELDIVNRARNTHLNSRAKNSSLHEYSLATQFEAIVGYWYLNGDRQKIDEMFENYVVEML